MKTIPVLRPVFFLVPSAILIGLGLWYVIMNAENYQNDINIINNSKRICDGKPCYCTNARCVTAEDLSSNYTGYFAWSIVFLIAGGIFVIVSRRWWK